MSIINICEYRLEDSLLIPGGYSLEIGMRSMDLTNRLLRYGMKHIAVESDPRISFLSTENFKFYNEAVVGDANLKEVELVVVQDAFCNHLNNIPFCFNRGGLELNKFKVKAVTIDDLMKRHNVGQFDLIAMDCEGSEEAILLSLKKPISKQISVEFHIHVGQSEKAKSEMILHLKSLGYGTVYLYEVLNVKYGLFVVSNP